MICLVNHIKNEINELFIGCIKNQFCMIVQKKLEKRQMIFQMRKK